jgi:hypothetical protein
MLAVVWQSPVLDGQREAKDRILAGLNVKEDEAKEKPLLNVSPCDGGRWTSGGRYQSGVSSPGPQSWLYVIAAGGSRWNVERGK